MKTEINRKVKVSAVIGLIAILIGGCATIMTGTKQEIKIASVPEAASVRIERLESSGKKVSEWDGITPATVILSRKNVYLVTISLDGYERAEIPIEKDINNWEWGNFVFGFIIGLYIDYWTGAANNLVPYEINVKLVTIAAQNMGGKPSVFALLCSTGADGKPRNYTLALTPKGEMK
jgi:uncharacterized protein YceK